MKRILIAAVLIGTISPLGAFAQTPARPAQPTGQTPPALPTPPTAKPAAPAATAPAPIPFPAGAKVAFVNMQLVVSESKLGQAGQVRMKAVHDKNQATLAPMAKQIQDQTQKINSQTGVVTDTVLNQLRRDLERMNLDAQTAQQKATAEEQNLNEDLLKDFSEKAAPILEALRNEKELWVIFGVQDTTDNGGQLIVASANGGLDLSLELVKRLDAKYPG